MEYQGKTGGDWREIQEAYWSLRKSLMDSLDDLARYDLSDIWLWQMRPELPLADQSRLVAIADKYDDLVERFEKKERP